MSENENKAMKNLGTVLNSSVDELIALGFGLLQAISWAKGEWGPSAEDAPEAIQHFMNVLDAEADFYLKAGPA